MRHTLRAGIVAALAATVAMILILLSRLTAGTSLELQPSFPAAPPADFVAVINGYPGEMLRLFAADSLFILSYLLVFGALYAIAARQSPALATIGLIAGGLAAFFDAAENAVFITFATLAQQGVQTTVGELPLPALYIVANLKWMAAYAALYAFGLAFPRESRLDWLLVVLMLLFPLVGALTMLMPALIAMVALLMLLGMPLFAFYFWRQTRKELAS